MKKIDFIKVCSDLDKSGFYKSSDKLEKLVKLSQGLYGAMENPTPLYSDLATTNLPYTGNALIDSALSNPSDTAMGREFAGGKMFDPTAPYEGPGPDAPFIAPYQPTATEQRDMDPDVLLDLTKENAQQAANYISQIYEPFAQLNALQTYGFNSDILNDTLPSFGANISRQLMSKPLETWSQIIDQMVRKTRETSPPQAVNRIQATIKKALTDVVRNSKLDTTFADRLKKSPAAQKLLRDYSVTV